MSIRAKLKIKYQLWRQRHMKQEIPYPLPKLKKVHRDITDPYPGPNPRTLVDKHKDITWERDGDLVYLLRNGVRDENAKGTPLDVARELKLIDD